MEHIEGRVRSKEARCSRGLSASEAGPGLPGNSLITDREGDTMTFGESPGTLQSGETCCRSSTCRKPFTGKGLPVRMAGSGSGDVDDCQHGSVNDGSRRRGGSRGQEAGCVTRWFITTCSTQNLARNRAIPGPSGTAFAALPRLVRCYRIFSFRRRAAEPFAGSAVAAAVGPVVAPEGMCCTEAAS